MSITSKTLLTTALAVVLGAASVSAFAQYGGPGPGPRGPGGPPGHFRRPPPPPPPRYYHNYNGPYYAAPVYAPPPVVYAPQPSVGVNLVIPFHF